ncbi:Lyzozyme M1 (1,4-beta-N-acetylmuramidase), GH25 family [Salinibacillus kushneri]|uniref:Lyzozyme M1 (1,4-beta-N-acetylmuramidase), GH25 family n=1 Tax=Salinibacillus kushneri TaxID=237682 RepID=A0A1I0B8R0_9BACI|nr:glycoside hydrolase family 25 protein [Salinibacillus kushneri]SET02804.1 Lyzozyme M1 (1,4-beta-N-acetylmuramidase), GH25 family [Salinibacillus kushneri]
MVKLKGIDVSKHQGNIDWDAVKKDGIEFAMIRMGYGSDIKSQDDEKFERNVRECERVGIPWGAYLYSYAMDVQAAKSEADHALRLLKGKNPTFPVAFDMEDADHYKRDRGMPSDKELVEICHTFLDKVEDAGYYVSLYANLHWLTTKLNSSKLNRFDKWVAQWSDECTYDGQYKMWQYTSTGHVDGIAGRVDMNYAYSHFRDKKEQPKKEDKEEKLGGLEIYTVRSGDTLSKIAAKYDTTVDQIAQNNDIDNIDLIHPGQKLTINGSVKKKYYIVEEGDNLTRIADAYDTTVNQLAKWNNIKNKNLIYTGQKLRVK